MEENFEKSIIEEKETTKGKRFKSTTTTFLGPLATLATVMPSDINLKYSYKFNNEIVFFYPIPNQISTVFAVFTVYMLRNFARSKSIIK